jgi:tetratricopeptide (TPR) repeat protein
MDKSHSPNQGPAENEIKISTWSLSPQHRILAVAAVAGLLAIAGVLYMVFWMEPAPNRQADASDPWLWAVPIAIVGTLVVTLLIYARFSLAWTRLASLPAREIARGDFAAAERAFQAALARAMRFPPTDERRGVMLFTLAGFLANQGRRQEARNLFEQSVEVLSHYKDWKGINHLIALNNFAAFLMTSNEYADAQRILHKVIDLIPTMKKTEDGQVVYQLGVQVEEIELISHLNLAHLLIRLGEVKDSETQLDASDVLYAGIKRLRRRFFHDAHLAQRCLWHCAAGNFQAAWLASDRFLDPTFPVCTQVRGRVHLERKEFVQAEKQFRLHFENERQLGTFHRPELLEVTLDLAEALFGQSKHADAFASFEEARAIVADFALPADHAWRKALATWLQRAKDLGRTELAASLEKELAQVSATPLQAITILEKFRIQPPAAT